MNGWSTKSRLRLALAASLAAAACGETVQGPGAGLHKTLAFALASAEGGSANAIFGGSIDSVRIMVYRPDESTAAARTIPWPADVEALRLTVDVEMIAPVETLYVYLDLLAGQSVLFYANGSVVVRERAVPEIPPLPLYYGGPGYDAVSLAISQRNVFVQPNGTLQLSASSYNGQGQLSGSPIGWSVSDTRLATIDAQTGLLAAKSASGALWVRAFTPNGLRDSTQVTIATQLP